MLETPIINIEKKVHNVRVSNKNKENIKTKKKKYKKQYFQRNKEKFKES